MDTTPEYIKMCEKAEIQKGWKPKFGDYCSYIDKEDGDNRIVIIEAFMPDSALWFAGRNGCGFKEDCAWLPRQDQLQEMIIAHKSSDRGALVIDAHVRFNEWIENTKYRAGLVDSFEQLWLAFVMQEKYNKTWNGEEWKEA